MSTHETGQSARTRALTAYRSLTPAPPSEDVTAPPEALLAAAPVPIPENARWEGYLGFEGQMTGDGRLIDEGALRWEASPDRPIPLRYVKEDRGAHDGAVTVATIDTIERRDGGALWGAGEWDLGSEAGREAYRLVALGLMDGVSMDLDDVTFEVRVAGDILDSAKAEMEAALSEDEVEPVEREEDEEGRVTVVKMSPDDEVMVTTDGRIRAATIVSIPAFADARITNVAVEGSADEVIENGAEALVAAAAPAYSEADFLDPHLPGPTALTVTEDGRVFGHLALWGTCHIASPEGAHACTQPPASESGYAYFRTGAVLTKEGVEVPVGHITMNTSHAPLSASPVSTLAHYENTGTVVALVAAGEDAHGVWVAGRIAEGVTDAQVAALRAAPLSGDWRRVNGGLELVAVLAVNVPGFPVPRTRGIVASGNVSALVAAGMVAPEPSQRMERLSDEDVRYLRLLAARERQREGQSLAARVRAFRVKRDEEANRAKVSALAARRGLPV